MGAMPHRETRRRRVKWGSGAEDHMPYVVYERYKGGTDVNLALIQPEERTRWGRWKVHGFEQWWRCCGGRSGSAANAGCERCLEGPRWRKFSKQQAKSAAWECQESGRDGRRAQPILEE